MSERTAEQIPGWRWRPGMRFRAPWAGITVSWTVTFADNEAGVFRAQAENGEEMEGSLDGLTPDLGDPGNGGHMLALLGEGYATAGSIDGWWSVGSWPTVYGEGSTVARSCTAAAEALGYWPATHKP